MEPKNLQFLSCLRENSREKLTEISKKTNIPISTLFDQLKELENSVITKHTSLINFSQLGYHTQAQVFLKVAKEDREKLKNHLAMNTSVNSLHKINNGWDFLIETIHHNIKELDQFLEGLDQKFRIENRQIHYLIEEIKNEGFLPN